MRFDKPVIILGAPRSGTSLMQQIIRERREFASVPSESGAIWFQYCHPALRNWQYEGIRDEGIDDGLINEIRRRFEDSALSSATWRRWSKVGLMNNSVIAAVVRKSYRPLMSIVSEFKKMAPAAPPKSRLVDKSVHCALWLNLVEKVFPDALYIHITRNGQNSIDSMLSGWLDPHRFNTYKVPAALAMPGYAGDYWNFALPKGWQAYIEKPIEEVVAFQWRAIQQAILRRFEGADYGTRVLQVRLEALVGDPIATLRKIARFIEVPWDPCFEQYSQSLPVVNSCTQPKARGGELRYPERIERIREFIQPTQARLGYVS